MATRPNGTFVLLGQPCDNTSIVADVLREAGIEPSATILADPAAPLVHEPAVQGTSALYRAASPQVTRKLLELLQPDLVIAACFPWRLSSRARSVTRFGVLNIHPSPLPYGRGPDPIFWVYRNGERETGVTIHLMDDDLDSGPILAQQRIAVPEGMDAVTLERYLFEIGATMAAELLPRALAGEAGGSPQDDQVATYQPAPSVHDWIISPLLPAAWAWRFVQGVEPLDGPLAVQIEGRLVPIHRAISWSDHGAPPDVLPPEAFAVKFRPGWVIFER